MNWAPPHIISNDPVKKPTNKTYRSKLKKGKFHSKVNQKAKEV